MTTCFLPRHAAPFPTFDDQNHEQVEILSSTLSVSEKIKRSLGIAANRSTYLLGINDLVAKFRLVSFELKFSVA